MLLLVAMSGVISALMDLGEFFKKWEKGQISLAAVFGIKGLINLGSAGFGVGALVVSLNGALEARLATKIAPYVTARLATSFGLRFGLMVFFMSVGVWLTIAAVGLELLILLIDDGDDDFQDWLEKTPFAKLSKGGERDEALYPSLTKQTEALDKALEGVWGIKKSKSTNNSESSAANIPNFDDMRLMP